MNQITVFRRIPMTAAAVGVVLILSACGQSSDGATPAGAAQASGMAGMSTSSSEESAASNEADVAFAQMMIPDHEMMAEMGKLAEKKAVNDDLKTIATQLRKGQSETATALQGMLKDWGQTVSSDMAGMEMSGAMTDADMDMLKSMKGKDFDTMFAEMMVKHHKGSIKMARDEEAKGANAEAKALAADMVTEQEAQVKILRKIA